jgi:hypothetical protein
MKSIIQKVLLLAVALTMGQGVYASELCLESWEEGTKRSVGYLGNGSNKFGDFCLRAEMFVSKNVGGDFCMEMDESGAVEYNLHGSSFDTGRDCYSEGYNDSMHHWSHSCAFTGKDRFLVRTKSVNLKFCREREKKG